MARLTIKAADEVVDQLIRLAERGTDVAKAALYAGAGTVADALTAAAGSLPVGTPTGNTATGHPYTGLTQEDRDDIVQAVGIAKFDDSGDGVSTAIGFAGYTRRTEDGYPNGVPIPMLVRSLESGSSVREKHPFVRQAINGVRAQAVQSMAEAADRKQSEILGGG